MVRICSTGLNELDIPALKKSRTHASDGQSETMESLIHQDSTLVYGTRGQALVSSWGFKLQKRPTEDIHR